MKIKEEYLKLIDLGLLETAYIMDSRAFQFFDGMYPTLSVYNFIEQFNLFCSK